MIIWLNIKWKKIGTWFYSSTFVSMSHFFKLQQMSENLSKACCVLNTWKLFEYKIASLVQCKLVISNSTGSLHQGWICHLLWYDVNSMFRPTYWAQRTMMSLFSTTQSTIVQRISKKIVQKWKRSWFLE
jgi:hypothetical protein